MARGHLPYGSMVGWFMPLDTSLARGFLGRVFLGSSSYASMLYKHHKLTNTPDPTH